MVLSGTGASSGTSDSGCSGSSSVSSWFCINQWTKRTSDGCALGIWTRTLRTPTRHLATCFMFTNHLGQSWNHDTRLGGVTCLGVLTKAEILHVIASGPVRQWAGRYTNTTIRVPVDSGQWTSATVDRLVYLYYSTRTSGQWTMDHGPHKVCTPCRSASHHTALFVIVMSLPG